MSRAVPLGDDKDGTVSSVDARTGHLTTVPAAPGAGTGHDDVPAGAETDDGARQIEVDGQVEIDGSVRVAILGMFVISVLAAMYFARTLLIPLALALLLFLTFRPIVRWGARHHIPAALSAAVIVIGLITAIAGIFYTLSGPVTEAAENAPQIARQVQERFDGLRGRVETMMSVPEKAAQGAAKQATNEDPSDPAETVVVQTDTGNEIEFVQAIALNVVGVFSTLLVTLVLLFFLLASGSLFYEKLVQSFNRLEDKKQALFAVHQVERDISRYLLTITIINWGLGCAIGVAMWWLGMPNPLLWLVLAAVLNYLPYVGAIVGTATAFIVALLTFPSIEAALIVPIVYYALTTVEGSVVTPYFVGRRLQINTVSVFVFVALGAWLWGIFGALMAVPILVVVKEIFSSVPGGESIANFLSERPAVPPSAKAEKA